MAFNTSTKRIFHKNLLKTIESKVSGKVTIEEEKIIDKILDGYGLICITDQMASGEFIQFKGSVNFTAVFTQEDKSISSIKTILDFQEKTQVGGIDSFVLEPEIINYHIVKDSETTLTISLTIKTAVYGTMVEELQILSGNEDNFFTQNETIKINSVSSCAQSYFNISEELKPNVNMDKIVLSTVKTAINKVEANDNYATVDGSLYVNILYLDADNIRTMQKTLDFVQEVSMLNLEKTHALDVKLFEAGVNVSKSSDGDDNNIIIDVKLGVNAWGYKEENVDVITDLFSTSVNTVVSANGFNSDKRSGFFTDSDRQTITIDMSNKKRMDEIIYIEDPKIIVDKVCVNKGKGEIVGSLEQRVIFKNYDSDEILSEIISEMFELSVNLQIDNETNLQINPIVKARVNSYKNKAGKDISQTIDFDVEYSILSEEQFAFVSKVEAKNVLQPKDYSIIIVNNDKYKSVYEMAKSLEVSPEVLLMQNPGIEDGSAEKIVVYLKNK